MAWSSNYLVLLLSHSQEWLTAKKHISTQEKLISKVAKEIHAYRDEHHPDEGKLVNLEKARLHPSPHTILLTRIHRKYSFGTRTTSRRKNPMKEKPSKRPSPGG
jgi:hypothetical protein